MVEEQEMKEEIKKEEPGLTDEEIAEKMSEIIGAIPMKEETQNVHTFLYNVATARDTTKTGNISVEELGMPILPVRTYKELALFCGEVANMGYFSDYFNKKAEIVTSTSLSKEAKLLDLAVVNRREVADVTKQPPKPNKGWFKPKNRVPISSAEQL